MDSLHNLEQERDGEGMSGIEFIALLACLGTALLFMGYAFDKVYPIFIGTVVMILDVFLAWLIA